MSIITGVIGNYLWDKYKAWTDSSARIADHAFDGHDLPNHSAPWSGKKWYSDEGNSESVASFAGETMVVKVITGSETAQPGVKTFVYKAHQDKPNVFSPDDPTLAASEVTVTVTAIASDQLLLTTDHSVAPIKTVVTYTLLQGRINHLAWGGVVTWVVGTVVFLIFVRCKEAILSADLGCLGNALVFSVVGPKGFYYLWCFNIIGFTILIAGFLFGYAIEYANY